MLTDIHPEVTIFDLYLSLRDDGILTILSGYAWDGASGPAIDTKTILRGSLVHDALYQLMRLKLLGGWWREAADDELKKICLEDGMCKIRAWWVHRAVRRLAGYAANPKSKKEVLSAP